MANTQGQQESNNKNAWEWTISIVVVLVVLAFCDYANDREPSPVRRSESAGVLTTGSSDRVFVWKDEDARDEAFRLINARMQTADGRRFLMQYVACMVASGTPAVITDLGFASHDVIVTEGPQKGCRGNVVAEHFK